MSEENQNCAFSTTQFKWYKGVRRFSPFDFKDQSGLTYEDVVTSNKKRLRETSTEIYEPAQIIPSTSKDLSEMENPPKKTKTLDEHGYFNHTVFEPIAHQEMEPQPFTNPVTQSGRFPDFSKHFY